MKKIFSFLAVVFMSVTNHRAHAQCTPAGDPSVFGDHVWNQYVWNSFNWTDNYYGYDVDTNLLYQSTHLWTTPYNPTYSSTYSGCTTLYGGFSWSAKRKGFPAGNYSLDVSYGDGVNIYVHGTLVFVGGSGSNTAAWAGFLDDTSSVEVRSSYGNGGGRPYLALCVSQGNYNDWGDHAWNQYAFNYVAPPYMYAGYDTDTSLNYDSEHLWNRSTSPSGSDTYQGCYVSNEDFSLTVKRKGFSPSYYSIDVNEPYGSYATLSVDGIDQGDYVLNNYTAFTGYLNDSSTIKLTAYSNSGDKYLRMIFRKPVGDPEIFGDHVWNEYVWNSLDYATDYAGYDVDTSFNYSSTHLWSGSYSPHGSNTYQGTGIKLAAPYSWSAKKEGFTEGYYNIQITNGTDAELWVEGALVWQQNESNSIPSSNVWTGCLNDSSRIEFKSTNGGALTISKVLLSISTNGPSSICPGFSEIFTAPSTTGSYLWSTGETTQSITVNTSGNYTVNLIGCGTILSQSLAVAPLPAPYYTVYGNTSYYPCIEEYSKPRFWIENVTDEYYKFIWNNGDTTWGNYYQPSEPGDYFARGIDALGCLSEPSDTVSFQVLSIGDSTIFGDHQWNVYLHSDTSDGYLVEDPYGYGPYYVPGTSYAYRGYLVDTSLNFHSQDHWMGSWSPAYSTGFMGCGTSGDHFHINAKRQGFDCGTYQVNIPAHDDDGAYLYVDEVLVWSVVGIGNSINNVWSGFLNDDSRIEFKVYEFTGDNVAGVDVIPIQLFTPLTPTISGPTGVCGTIPIILDAGTGFSSYLWSTGSSTQTTSANAVGNYSVKVTDANGCVSTSQTTITTATQNTYYADSDGDGYGNNSVTTIDCSQPTGYAANNTDCNDANGAIHPNASDICNSIDDNCNGVTDENAINATVSPGATAVFCVKASVTLSANSGAGINYQWQKNAKNVSGATNQMFAASTAGNYRVKETNSFNCASTSAATAVSKSTVSATITPLGNLNICGTGSVTLQANSGIGYIYQWFKGANNISGATQQSYTATKTGTYKVTVTSSEGCSQLSKGTKVIKSCKFDAKDEVAEMATLDVFPNPSDGNFTLSLYLEEETNQQATIQIFNSLGQVVYEQMASLKDGYLNEQIHLVTNAPMGICIVRVIAGDQQFTSRIVIGH